MRKTGLICSVFFSGDFSLTLFVLVIISRPELYGVVVDMEMKLNWVLCGVSGKGGGGFVLFLSNVLVFFCLCTLFFIVQKKKRNQFYTKIYVLAL